MKIDARAYKNIWKIYVGHGGDYTVVHKIIHISKNIYKLIAIDLSKQQTFDANHKATRVEFTGNLDRGRNAAIIFILEEAKEAILDFSQRAVSQL